METIIEPNENQNVADIVVYFHGLRPKLKYKEIVSIINQYHGKSLTMRTFKRLSCKYSLSRKCNVSHEELLQAIRNEICTSISQVGYRQMTEILSLKYGMNVSKEAVRLALLEVDSEAVARRRRHTIQRRFYYTDGPGHVYHIDGNDKLKKWGFAIHGFSRKILWLVDSTTNNEPLAVAKTSDL